MNIKQQIEKAINRKFKSSFNNTWEYVGYSLTTIRIDNDKLTFDNTLTIVSIPKNDINTMAFKRVGVCNQLAIDITTHSGMELMLTL